MVRPLLLLLAAACLPVAARAGRATAALSVSALVQDACRVATAPGRLRVACPGHIPYSVAAEGARPQAGSGGTAAYDLRDAQAVTLTY